ncbi:uncharacterized protein LOC128159762 [Crassostrea angulata]|uniref:uncharacterized protein LOC128159762 n=1 Tax=Magallana angulata TaxID=2784310 RepID=UPI0022B1E16B|nr:uncharacterized protein LOC128159762 [Crassostrea angulata]
MDPLRNWAQDVLRCHLCETPVPPLYCAICHIHLCTTCGGEHLLDESQEHRVVPFKKRGSTPKCSTHSSKLCELHCETCDILICSLCVSSGEHEGHKLVDSNLKCLETKNVLQQELEELENFINPVYQKIASDITVQKADLKKNSEELMTAINEHGKDLHKEIDNIIQKLKSDLDEIDSKNLALLKKQEDKITSIISEITKVIAKLKMLMNSDDVRLISAFKFRNAEFRRLPPKLTVSLPSFIPQNINKKQLGSLSVITRSDPYSPTNIAERFTELYDDKWTGAFVDLSEKYSMTEEVAIKKLVQITEDSYKYCKDFSSKRYTDIVADLTLWKRVEPNSMLKPSIQEMGALVYESFYRELVSDHEWKKSVEPFIKECVRICWLMVDRDHPIYMKSSEKRGSEFDTNLYKRFTRFGQKMDYIVRPALFLHENGPLLCKGIAQPMAGK